MSFSISKTIQLSKKKAHKTRHKLHTYWLFARRCYTASPVKDKNIPCSTAERKAASQQKVALLSTGIFGLGHVIPIVNIIGPPLLLYNYGYILRKLQFAYRYKKKLKVALFDVLATSFALGAGYWFTASVLSVGFFTAHYLVARTEHEAQTDFSRIFGELSDKVWLLQAGVEVEIPLANIQMGDIIIVHAGEMIPVDGQIVSGEGLVDQHLLTGESQPIERKPQDHVLTSTLLISGNLHIQVKQKGTDTITGQIAKTLAHAATFKNNAISRGDRIVEQGASRTMWASALTLPFIGPAHAVAISYSGFGYQLRTAAPLMILNYLRIASQHGILIKDGRALDTLQHVDTVVFDKTGTLTEEIPEVTQLFACKGFTEQQVLRYAASAEQQQKHPIALAICQQARKESMALLQAGHTEYAVGHGLHVALQNTEGTTEIVLIGSERFITAANISIPDNILAAQTIAGEQGFSIVYLATQTGILMGAIELRPTLRPQTHEAIQSLHALGMNLYVISGDQEAPTQHLAKSLGIDHYFAEVLPQDKALHIERLQAAGSTVCFIGDGINDSIALQKADVAISLHGAATIAQDTADIVLMSPDLLHLPYLITLSRDLHRRLDYSERLNNTSGIACITGVLVAGMGLSGAIVLYCCGLLVNISSAMLPLLYYAQKTAIPDNTTNHKPKCKAT